MWTMLSAIFAPFIWLDAFVQKRFDSVCFFLMRRFGVRKSSIRYMLGAVEAIGHCAITVYLARRGWAVAAAVAAIFMLITLAHQHGTYILDREAEARSDGTVPHAYMPRVRGWHKLLIASNTVMMPTMIRAMPQHALVFFGWMVVTLAVLLQLYLAKTPMNPPAEKAREAVLTPRPSPAKP